MVSLLHCLLEIGINLLNRFCDVINEYIEKFNTAEIVLMHALTNNNLIIVEIVKTRDEFDQAPKGKRISHCKFGLHHAERK
jgi:hypothetical protein